MKYAIIKTDGKNYKVSEEDILLIDYRKGKSEKDVIEFDVVLLNNENEIKVGTPLVENAKVIAEVTKPLVKGKKLIVFKKKRRKGYSVKNGHRQKYTEIKITKIEG